MKAIYPQFHKVYTQYLWIS